MLIIFCELSAKIGGWDTILRKEEYEKLQSTLGAPTFIEIVMPNDEYKYDESALKIVEEHAPHVVERKLIITPKSTPSKCNRTKVK